MSTTTTRRPPAARKPQDRLPKATDTETPETLSVTVRDVQYDVDSEAMNDFELMGDLASAQDGDPSRMASALRRLLGAQQYRVAMDAIRDAKTGRVDLETGIEFVGELFEALSPNS